MVFGFELIKDLRHFAVLANEKADTVNTIVFFAHKLLRSPHPKSFRNRMVLVAEQREVEFIALSEFS